jgi:hypothetical protein
MARVTIVPTRSHHDATDTTGLYRGERFHLNLYEKARMVYNAWSMNTTSRKPTIDEIAKLPAT